MELSERRKQILCMAIEEYIKESSPITSGGIKDATMLECSTATLRNELNTLEALGYLRQLHTSGGRIPTPLGYRFYVENLLKGLSATNEQLEEVRQLISQQTGSLSDIVSGIANIVSKATNYPTVVMMSDLHDLILQEFRIIPLLDNKVMVLIGTVAGYINESLDISASQAQCQDASDYLTRNFKGETIGFFLDNIALLTNSMKEDIGQFQEIVDSLVGGLKKLNDSQRIEVKREGVVKLIESSNDIEEAKKVLSILDDEKGLKSALELENKEGDIEFNVVGGDNPCSVVKAPLVVGGKQLASIGVIGPQRMDYSRIAGAIKLVVEGLKSIKGE